MIEHKEDQALQRLIQAEIERQEAAEAVEAERNARIEAEHLRQTEAQAIHENAIAAIKSRMAAVTAKQAEWKERYAKFVAEIEALNSTQEAIQSEIAAIMGDTKMAVYNAQKNGVLTANEDTVWDKLGGASEDLEPFRKGTINNPWLKTTLENMIAAIAYAGNYYRASTRMLDGRKRAK